MSATRSPGVTSTMAAAAALFAAIGLTAPGLAAAATAFNAGTVDARVVRFVYDDNKIYTVAVARGVATHIVLDVDDEVQYAPATGMGSDCKRVEDAWCVTATGRDVFVKPKLGAADTDMSVVTGRRRYTFVLKVLPPASAQLAALQVSFEAPPSPPQPVLLTKTVDVSLPPRLSPQTLIENRMRAQPQVRNAAYSVAVGETSEDIVPVMVFDDGTQTYFSFPNNRPLPTVFQTAPDGTEEMVNTRMQDDMIVADRVARRFLLRLGNSVVAVINDKFDIDGKPPVNGTTVPGVSRVLRADANSAMHQQEGQQ